MNWIITGAIFLLLGLLASIVMVVVGWIPPHRPKQSQSVGTTVILKTAASILRVIELPARKAVLLRLTPRTLFLMPALAIITGTTGWYLAADMGFTALNWPHYAWVVAALVLVALMTIQGLGYLLPTNLRVCLELQRHTPDNVRIAKLTNRYFLAVATQGIMQVLTIIIMARFATGI